MAQSGGGPQEALGTGRDTAADCGLRLTHWTENLAWPGTQKKKKKIEVGDSTFHLTHSQYTDNGPTSSGTDTMTPGTWQGSHWSANFEVTGMTQPQKNPGTSGIQTRDLSLLR